MKNQLITILLLAIFSYTGFTQELDKVKLDNYFNALEQNNKLMGSVAVSKDGELIYTKTIGYADVDNKIPANINSKYRIGSISKTFTTVLVFKATELGKINLNQNIDKYFPAIKNAEKITISHLLSHRSGIPSFTDTEEYLTWNTKPKTKNEMVEIITKSGSDFEPDSKAEYSNSNFVLLTYILESTFAQPYSELLKQYITEPLDLKNTYLGSKINTNNNECNSYNFNQVWNIENETDISIPMGAGGIVSTASDLVKFSDALFEGKLVSLENLEKMKTIRDRYGMGLLKFPFESYTAYGHTGGIDGFSSVFSHFDNGKYSYALLSNGSNYNSNNISIAVLSAIFNKPYSIPEFKTFTVSQEDLDKYLGIYSSEELPLKITITKDTKSLIAQATGQPAFTLESTEKDVFRFDQAGIVMEFNPSLHLFVLKQGGGQYTFKRE